MNAFYGMTARSLRGEPVAFKDYAGKVVLVVNTATHCGLTPQYAGLEALYGKYRDRGLVVLAFPCNQFGRQEPGDAEAIGQTCQRNYGVTFPVFGKIEVNGPGAHPLFQWLTARLPGLVGRRVRWNFTKFLIGRDGMPIKRFAPITAPARLEPAVQAALGA
jgi:glutathione peroxidase